MRRRVLVAGAALAGVLGVAQVGSAEQVAERGIVNPPETATFNFTGDEQQFEVPQGVRTLSVSATGGRGGDVGSVLGGQAATVEATFAVNPGDDYFVIVGENGDDNRFSFNTSRASYGGGGAGGASRFNTQGTGIARTAASGGGATSFGPVGAAPILIAPGGGGAGSAGNPSGPAGGAGGDASAAGANGGGAAGTQRGAGGGSGGPSAGGAGGAGGNPSGTSDDGQSGQAGSANQGGNGGDNPLNSPPGQGGGGGGGLFGGGGGGGASSGGGGGGGGGGFPPAPSGSAFFLAPQDSDPTLKLTWQRPETTITKAPRTKIKTRKPKVTTKTQFESDFPDATFLCKVDDKPEVSCASPFEVGLRKGKHTIAVRSVAPSGNEDVTAATATVRVIRKKKKKG